MKRPLVALSAFALLAAACSSPGGNAGEPTPGTTATTATTASSDAAPKTIGRLGDTLDLTRADGSRVGVTLVQIINPASVDPRPRWM